MATPAATWSSSQIGGSFEFDHPRVMDTEPSREMQATPTTMAVPLEDISTHIPKSEKVAASGKAPNDGDRACIDPLDPSAFADALRRLEAVHEALLSENARLRSQGKINGRSEVAKPEASIGSEDLSNLVADERLTPGRSSVKQTTEHCTEKFCLRSNWRTRAGGMARHRSPRMANTWTTDIRLNSSRFAGRFGRYIVSPASGRRLCWDVVSMCLIFFDFAVVPMTAFNVEDNLFMTAINWFSLVFWSFDVVAGFLTGYFVDARSVMVPSEIAMHYAKTWLIPDLFIVSFDWIFNVLLASSGSSRTGTGNLGKLLRILRLARMARLIRLLKLKRIISLIQDNINSDYFTIMLEFAKLVSALLMLSHILACAWYFTGTSAGHGQKSWVSQHMSNSSSLDDRYLTSLHWALSYLALETIDINPQNTSERTFAIIVTFFGLIVSSSMVSRITTLMVRLQTMKTDTTKQFWLLRRYLREHNVPQRLAVRIRRYLEYACEEREAHVQEEKLEVLSLLSSQLRNELRAAINEQHLSAHPFFTYLSQVSNVTMHRLCSMTLSIKPLAPGDPLFFHGEAATHMYFVVRGLVKYLHAQDEREPVVVEKGSCLCEPVLWVNWYHRGDAQALSESEVLTLEASAFGEVMRSNPTVQVLASDYAEFCITGLNEANDAISDILPKEEVFRRFDIFLQIHDIEDAQKFVKRFTV